MQKIAHFLKRFPWIAVLGTHVYRLGRPRFSVGAIGVVLNPQDEVLLVEHVFHPKHPWGLPGGWVDRAETLQNTVMRELQEELGLAVSVQRILYTEIVPSYPYHIDVVFLCRAQSEVTALSPELLSYGWFRQENLPDLHPLHRKIIHEVFNPQDV